MTVSVTIYTLKCVPGETHRAFVLAHQRWPVGYAWTKVKYLLIQYSLMVNKFTPRLYCHFVGTSQLLCFSVLYPKIPYPTIK